MAPGNESSKDDLPSPLRGHARLRIFCAHGESLVSQVVVRLFKTAGHNVVDTANGIDAWDRLSKDVTAFDVVIVEHEMPGLNGLAVVRLLHQANYGGKIVVHGTALSQDDAATYRTFGVRQIVTKPVDADQLLAIAEAVHGE